MTIYPGGAEGQAAWLRQEGFEIETQGKALKVKNFKARLVRFE